MVLRVKIKETKDYTIYNKNISKKYLFIYSVKGLMNGQAFTYTLNYKI